jgi:hypothetical protein
MRSGCPCPSAAGLGTLMGHKRRLALPVGPLRRFRLPLMPTPVPRGRASAGARAGIAAALAFVVFNLLLYWLSSSDTWQRELRELAPRDGISPSQQQPERSPARR